MKLMKQYIPIELLQLLENWLSDSLACVKWGNSWSQTFKISSGVRQLPGLMKSAILVYILCAPTNSSALSTRPNGPFTEHANSIFAKVGRLASEEVMVQLLKQKCLPILLHALDVCNLNKRTVQSLDFTLNRFFMKLFKTSNIEVVNYCQTLLDVSCQVPC